MAKDTSIVKKDAGQAVVPSYVQETENSAAQKVQREDCGTPWMQICQSAKQQLEHEAEGLKLGSFFRKMPFKEYGPKIELVILDFDKLYSIWEGPEGNQTCVARKSMHGMVPELNVEAIANPDGSLKDVVLFGKDGSRPKASMSYMLICLVNGTDYVLFNMKSTAVKEAKMIMSKFREHKNLPVFAHNFEFALEKQTDSRSGNIYFVPKVRSLGWAAQDVYARCQAEIATARKRATETTHEDESGDAKPF